MENFVKKYKTELIALGITGVIIGYILYKQNTFKKDLDYNYIIGDKFARYIYDNPESLFGYDNSLQNDGLTINKLIGLILKNPIPNKYVNRIFLSIGTFDNFKHNDNIKKLFKLLKFKFPKAKFYVIKGSTLGIHAEDLNQWYENFKPFATILNNSVGNADINNEADSKFTEIAKEINSIIPEAELRTRA